MQVNVTYGIIHNWNNEIAGWFAAGSFLTRCNRDHIQWFMSNYLEEITMITEFLRELQKKYCKLKDGKAILPLEFNSEDDAKAYMNEFNAFMSKPINTKRIQTIH